MHLARCTCRTACVLSRFFFCAQKWLQARSPFVRFYPLSRSSRGNISTKHGGGHKTDAYLCILGFGWKKCVSSRVFDIIRSRCGRAATEEGEYPQGRY